MTWGRGIILSILYISFTLSAHFIIVGRSEPVPGVFLFFYFTSNYATMILNTYPQLTDWNSVLRRIKIKKEF